MFQSITMAFAAILVRRYIVFSCTAKSFISPVKAFLLSPTIPFHVCEVILAQHNG